MGKFVIEKGIPVPPIQKKNKNGYPFEHMDVGDSFFVKTDDKGDHIRLTSSVHSFGRIHGMKFSIRMVDGGSRVWRVK